jgi:FixJ family two-component response regulator
VNKPCTVFIVDDDDGSRRSVEALAASMGAATASFASAEEFLQAYDSAQPGCLVTDLRMAGMTGLDLQEQLNGLGRRIPVILMTAYADVPVAVRAMEQGAVTVLEKPCFNSQLWDAISKGLALDVRRRAQDAQRRDCQDRLQELTLHEREVMALVVAGAPNKTIAKRLDVSVRTVENRRQNIFRKMGVTSVATLVQAVLLAEGKLSE